MAKTQSIDIEDIVLDAGTQTRAELSEDTIEDYHRALEAVGFDWPFPPIEVFHDGTRYLLSSGFHRTLAAKRHGRHAVPCIVHKGSVWDALLHGMKANAKNGLRKTQADRRRCVEILLDSGKELTQAEIAELAEVSERTVRYIVAERKNADRQIAGSDELIEDTDDAVTDGDRMDAVVATNGRTTESEKDKPTGGSRKGKASPVGVSRTPAEELSIQRSKTIKTAEALMRAFDDLNRLCEKSYLEEIIDDVAALVVVAKQWK